MNSNTLGDLRSLYFCYLFHFNFVKFAFLFFLKLLFIVSFRLLTSLINISSTIKTVQLFTN